MMVSTCYFGAKVEVWCGNHVDLIWLGHVKLEIYVLDVDVISENDTNIVISLINEYKASFEVLAFMKRLQF